MILFCYRINQADFQNKRCCDDIRKRNCIKAEYKESSRSYCKVIEVVNRSSGIFLVFIVICLYKESSRSYCEVVDLNHSFGSAAAGQKARHW